MREGLLAEYVLRQGFWQLPQEKNQFFFSGLRVWHMEFPRLRVESELQLPSCTTAPATPDQATSVTYTIVHVNDGSLTH